MFNHYIKKLGRRSTRTPSPTKQLSDREIVEAMNAMLQNEENIKALKEEELYVEKKVEKTMYNLKKLWSD